MPEQVIRRKATVRASCAVSGARVNARLNQLAENGDSKSVGFPDGSKMICRQAMRPSAKTVGFFDAFGIHPTTHDCAGSSGTMKGAP